MAVRLLDLQRRVSSQRLRRRKPAAGALAPKALVKAKVPPPVAPARSAGRLTGLVLQSSRPPRPRAQSTGLKDSLIAVGLPAEEAERIAREAAAFDRAAAQTLVRPMGEAVQAKLPAARPVGEETFNDLVMPVIRLTPLHGVLEKLFAACNTHNLAIALGKIDSAGLVVGVELSYGVVFGPGRQVGIFGSLGLSLGFIASITTGLQCVVVRGGITAFDGSGVSVMAGAGVPIPVVPGLEAGGNVSALFNLDGTLVGGAVAVTIGVGKEGLGAVVEFAVTVGHTVSHTVTAQTRGARARLKAPPGLRRIPVAASRRHVALSGREVELKLRAFIPSPAVAMSLPGIGDVRAFGGDGRSFSYSSGTARGEVTGMVTLRGSARVTARRWGKTTEYDPASVVPAASKPDWWRELVEGASPINHATLTATDENLNIVPAAAATDGATAVKVILAGANPLISASPDIDAELLVELIEKNGAIDVAVTGAHDGFPAYELYVNGTAVYTHDPVATNQTPLSLLPPAEFDVGVRVPLAA